MERGNDLASFQRFLDKFCQTIADEGESEDLPIRLSNHRLLTDEIEGECLEWSVRYLEPRMRSSNYPSSNQTVIAPSLEIRLLLKGEEAQKHVIIKLAKL